MFYYKMDGHLLCSARHDLPFPAVEPPADAPKAVFLFEADPQSCRASFSVGHPGQLAQPEGIRWLDASRLPDGDPDPLLGRLIQEGRLRAVNYRHPQWESLISCTPDKRKKRVNILAIGDVGSTLLTGLKLLGQDVISSIGI